MFQNRAWYLHTKHNCVCACECGFSMTCGKELMFWTSGNRCILVLVVIHTFKNFRLRRAKFSWILTNVFIIRCFHFQNVFIISVFFYFWNRRGKSASSVNPKLELVRPYADHWMQLFWIRRKNGIQYPVDTHSFYITCTIPKQNTRSYSLSCSIFTRPKNWIWRSK